MIFLKFQEYFINIILKITKINIIFTDKNMI